MANALIEVESVTKRFRIPSVRRTTIRDHALDFFRPRNFDELTVLDGVSFQVRPGETVGLMGRNGCGKSTLLKILAGIYQPDSGRVRLRGPLTPILELGVGWNPELDAVDNIFLIGSVMGLSLRELRGSIEEILAFAELERFANLKLQHYSSGMASRLAYAIAFKAVREILVLDEIFAVGDAEFTAKCEDRYRELSAAGHTIILVSHNPTIIANFCQRGLLIEGGKIIAEGNALEVARSYFTLLGAHGEPPKLEADRRQRGETPSSTEQGTDTADAAVMSGHRR
jgi:ABC-type polysaccharide/polyol phosphate transport system ATPase subunit